MSKEIMKVYVIIWVTNGQKKEGKRNTPTREKKRNKTED